MTSRSPRACCVAALFAAAVALAPFVPARGAARAQQAEAAYDPFAQSRVRLSFTGGVAATGDDTYLTLGVGVGYYVLDGLELGVNTDLWFLGDPTFLNVTPGVLYVFPIESPVKPYLGPFYRHAFVFGGDEDLDSLGGRAGIYYYAGGSAFFGAGAVYEHWLGCDSSSFVDCDALYPEVVLGLSF